MGFESPSKIVTSPRHARTQSHQQQQQPPATPTPMPLQVQSCNTPLQTQHARSKSIIAATSTPITSAVAAAASSTPLAGAPAAKPASVAKRPPPIPSPSAFAIDKTNAIVAAAATAATNGTPSQRSVNPQPRVKSATPRASAALQAQWHATMEQAFPSFSSPSNRYSRSASASPASIAAANAPSTHATSDRFMAARRDLSQAIALVQTQAHVDAYGDSTAAEVAAAARKENAGEDVIAEATRAATALNKAEFAQLLSHTLMPSTKGGRSAAVTEHESPSVLSFHSNHNHVARSPSASPPSSASKAAAAANLARNGYNLTPRALHFPPSSSSASCSSPSVYQSQLNNTYRTPNGSAASAAAAGVDRASMPVQPPSSLRTSSLYRSAAASASSPTIDRTLASRAASLAPHPVRVLDTPGLANDYYLNLLHWNARNGVLAIGLGPDTYLWDSATQAITNLAGSTTGDDGEEQPAVTSLRWQDDGTNLAVGYASHQTKIWDVASQRAIQTLNSHAARVSCLDFNSGGVGGGRFTLASGGADASIYLHDLRLDSRARASITASYTGYHREEVCGLAFSHDGTQLASGGNDNTLCIFNLRGSSAIGGAGASASTGAGAGHLTLHHHSAAVKALAWCPWSDRLLASGGGLADGHIRFCNSLTGAQTLAVDTKSQVCSLQFARGGERELLSAHGHPDHSLSLWKIGNPLGSGGGLQAGPGEMQRISSLRGHQARVLHTSLSPDGSTVVSAGADETLRFWKVWKASPLGAAASGPKRNQPQDMFRSSPGILTHIR